MKNTFVKNYIIAAGFTLVMFALLLYNLLPGANTRRHAFATTLTGKGLPEKELIQYGYELIVHTAAYLGPKGSVASISNGMNCGNCHLEAGTRKQNGNAYFLVASTYPKYRQRSGTIETISYRINDCVQRSLNGKPLDTASLEMAAIKAYILSVGAGANTGVVTGTGVARLAFLPRAASAVKGAIVYRATCTVCHGNNGEGQLLPATNGYLYPPLWGGNSYNVSAGLYRISMLAGFIKYNMPYNNMQQPPLLSDEEAWDVAAYINSRQRDTKRFRDWPEIKNKPFDYPFGPYADGHSEAQHKYGPWNK